WVCEHSVYCCRICLGEIAARDECDALGIGEELRRRLEGRVAAAHDYGVLTRKERTITRGTVGETLVFERCGSWNVELATHAAGRDEECLGLVRAFARRYRKSALYLFRLLRSLAQANVHYVCCICVQVHFELLR